MNKYFGLTIGPIVDTLSMVSKPAGLWGASYMFSYLSEQLCLLLVGENIVKEEDFLMPVVGVKDGKLSLSYRDKNSMTDAAWLMREAGVGLLHDRIIWSAADTVGSDTYIKVIQNVIERAKANVADAIVGSEESDSVNRDYLRRYLQVQGVCVAVEDADSPLLLVSNYLDAIELQRQIIPKETKNVVIEYLDNEKIKKVKYFPNNLKFALMKKTGDGKTAIKTIEEVCSAGRVGYKTERYFAIVQADGDNIGAALKQSGEKNRDFSRMCVKMAATASEIVNDYGGYMIYAGGDDLLFLAPLVGKNPKENILTLLYKLSGNFRKIAENELQGMKLEYAPTLSFGVSIQYYKYPLYEAFSCALGQLLFVAKNPKLNSDEKSKEKDAIAINLQKHSGQSVSFYLKDVSSSATDETMQNHISYHRLIQGFLTMEGKSDIMNSVFYLLTQFRAGLVVAFGAQSDHNLTQLFLNVFDNSGQEIGSMYVDKIMALALAIKRDDKLKSVEVKVDTFLSLLRLVQFYYERGEE